ncbi:MAG: WGR and DUF4132 domain-containing protein [Planctomycetota bacterium]
MSRRSLVFRDGSSEKFWTIELEDNSHTVCFGRVGTNGQTKTKEFDDSQEAQKSFDKLVAQKLKKGYADDGTSTTTKKAVVAKKKSATKKATKKKTAKKKSIPAPATAKKKTAKKAAKKAATKKKAAPVEATPAVTLQVTDELGLQPADYFAASFHPRDPLVLGEPGEADIAAQVSRLAKLKTETYGWRIKFETLALEAPLPVEEAHFWFNAMTRTGKRFPDRNAVKEFAESIEKSGPFNGKLSVKEATKAISGGDREVPRPLMLTLLSLFDFKSILEIVLTAPKGGKRHAYAVSEKVISLCEGFRTHVVPYLSSDDKEAMRERVRETLDTSFTPPDSYSAFQAEHYVAASLGMHDEIGELFASWEDGHYAKAEEWCSHYQSPQSLLCGLGSAGEVESEWRRLKVPITKPEEAKVLLACTGLAGLDILSEQIAKQSNKDEAAKLMTVLANVRAPEAAEPILHCRLESRAPSIARDWLATEVGNAVTGLLETAGGKGKLADAAVEYLRGVKRSGHGSFIAKQLKRIKGQPEVTAKVTRDVIDHVEKVYEPLTDATTPSWFQESIDAQPLAKKPKMPQWAMASQLPPMILKDDGGNECRLNDDQVNVVLQTLAATPVTERHPLLVALKEHAERNSRDAFAWRMFELWQEDGSNSKNKWAMGAIGHLGDDECVMKLTPMVRVWPGESQHARAVFGLECLRGVGTNTALMQLSGIAQKLKFKGLKTKAAAFVEDIAKERGMTRAELEDRVIPDCGLDEQGRREFSFGPRSFSFVLSGDLKPMVRDEAGKVRPNPPKPGVKDDADVAAASLAEWKLIKKQIKEVATLQAGRLEQAMVTGRRWTLSEFESLLVRHPLMTHLVQKLIWGAFDKKGKRKELFRVTEERDYADVKDDSFSISKDHQVGLVHPLEMSEPERGTWGEVMSDYELIAPFPQLGREVFSIEKNQGVKKALSGFDGTTLAAPTMVFTLEKLGWIRGEAMDAGCFDEHSKQFPSADVTAVIHYDGIVGMGYIDPEETLKIQSVNFCPGMRAPSGYGWGDEKTCKLKEVSPLVISEVLADLHVLKSKAK